MTERDRLELNYAGACYEAMDHESCVDGIVLAIQDTMMCDRKNMIPCYKALQNLAHKLIYAAQHGTMLEERVMLAKGYLQEYDKEQNNASPVLLYERPQ